MRIINKSSMANSSDVYSPQRHATRAPVERSVRLQFEKSQQVSEGECRNISIGGMFVLGRCPGAPGETVRFELGLDDGSAIRGLADVMWIRASDGGPGKELGFGLKFKFLEQRDRQLIFKLVSRHIKDRLASRHPSSAHEVDPALADMVVPPVVARPTVPPPTAPPPAVLPPMPVGAEPTAAAQPSGPAPRASGDAMESPARPSIFDADDGLETSSEPQPSGPPSPRPPSSRLSSGSDGVELPDDWDSDPTAFEIPTRTESQEEATPIGSQQAMFSGAAPTPGVPMPPAPLESEVGSLSNVFMQDQDFALDLPLDPRADSEPDFPLVTNMPADAASDPYLRHLGEDHFDHRPAPKRDLPVLPIASLVLVLAAALGYLFSDQLFEWAHADDPAPTATSVPEPANAPGSVYSPPSQKAGAPNEDDPPPSQSPDSQAPQPSTKAPAPAAPPRSETQRPPASRPERGRAFKGLSDVTWRADGQGLMLMLTVDGTASKARVDHFRLEGESPREVVRLLGVDRRASLSTLTVNEGGVKQIRFGWHKKQRGHEIHLVMDMVDRQSRVLSVRPEGNRIMVRIGRAN